MRKSGRWARRSCLELWKRTKEVVVNVNLDLALWRKVSWLDDFMTKDNEIHLHHTQIPSSL